MEEELAFEFAFFSGIYGRVFCAVLFLENTVENALDGVARYADRAMLLYGLFSILVLLYEGD